MIYTYTNSDSKTEDVSGSEIKNESKKRKPEGDFTWHRLDATTVTGRDNQRTSKLFTCPTPNCDGVYETANQLEYHMMRESCDVVPAPRDSQFAKDRNSKGKQGPDSGRESNESESMSRNGVGFSCSQSEDTELRAYTTNSAPVSLQASKPTADNRTSNGSQYGNGDAAVHASSWSSLMPARPRSLTDPKRHEAERGLLTAPKLSPRFHPARVRAKRERH